MNIMADSLATTEFGPYNFVLQLDILDAFRLRIEETAEN